MKTPKEFLDDTSAVDTEGDVCYIGDFPDIDAVDLRAALEERDRVFLSAQSKGMVVLRLIDDADIRHRPNPKAAAEDGSARPRDWAERAFKD